MIVFSIPLTPVAKGRARTTKMGWTYTPKKTKDAESDIRGYWHSQGFKMLPDTALVLDIVFYVRRPKKPKHKYPIVRPDTDNYVKLVLDALNGLAWRDDSIITDLHVKKRYAEKEPRIDIWISVAE